MSPVVVAEKQLCGNSDDERKRLLESYILSKCLNVKIIPVNSLQIRARASGDEERVKEQ